VATASISRCEPTGISLSGILRFIGSASNSHVTVSPIVIAPMQYC